MPTRRTKVAIGLPVFNGENFIATTLESLLGQTYGDFELIISDNASTDRTEEICLDFAKRDARIRYVRQLKNLGAIPNFNLVFELSNSRYFKWAAVDDFCDPTYLEKAVQVMDEHSEVIWCHSRTSHIDAAGQLLDDPDSLDVSYSERQSSSPGARFKAVLLGNKGSIDSYGLIRSEAIRKTPLYLSYYGPEKIFMAELALLGPYQEITETLFFVRVLAEGSGNLKTASEQQTFIDTKRRRPIPLVRIHFLVAYLKAIHRARPGWAEMAKCYLAILQWLFQVSKWQSVLMKFVRGEGVGGGNRKRVERINQRRNGLLDNQGDTAHEKGGQA